MAGQLTANLAAAAGGELSGMRALAGGGLFALLPATQAAAQQLVRNLLYGTVIANYCHACLFRVAVHARIYKLCAGCSNRERCLRLQDARGKAAADAVKAAMGTPGWGDAVLAQLAHTHPATSGTGESLKNRSDSTILFLLIVSLALLGEMSHMGISIFM